MTKREAFDIAARAMWKLSRPSVYATLTVSYRTHFEIFVGDGGHRADEITGLTLEDCHGNIDKQGGYFRIRFDLNIQGEKQDG